MVKWGWKNIENFIIGALFIMGVVSVVRGWLTKKKILVVQEQIEWLKKDTGEIKVDVNKLEDKLELTSNKLENKLESTSQDIKQLIKKDADIELYATKNVVELTSSIEKVFLTMGKEKAELLTENEKLNSKIQLLESDLKQAKSQVRSHESTIKSQDMLIKELQPKPKNRSHDFER